MLLIGFVLPNPHFSGAVGYRDIMHTLKIYIWHVQQLFIKQAFKFKQVLIFMKTTKSQRPGNYWRKVACTGSLCKFKKMQTQYYWYAIYTQTKFIFPVFLIKTLHHLTSIKYTPTKRMQDSLTSVGQLV